MADPAPPVAPIFSPGSFLRTLRARAQRSQVDVAKAVGLTDVYYGMIERGQRRPSAGAMLKILSALDATPEERRQGLKLLAQATTRFMPLLEAITGDISNRPFPPRKPISAAARQLVRTAVPSVPAMALGLR